MMTWRSVGCGGGGGEDVSTISRRSDGDGGVVSTTRSPVSAMLGWKLCRKTATSTGGEGKTRSIHRAQHAGKASGRRYLPAQTAVDPRKFTIWPGPAVRRREQITRRPAAGF